MEVRSAVCATLAGALLVAGAATAAAPPSEVSVCSRPLVPSTHTIWLHADDGQQLYAIDGGAGVVGVVLVPESPPGDVCDWLPFFRSLERSHLRVLAVDYRGTGQSFLASGVDQFAYGRDLAAAVAHLRSDGARRIVLVGASLGGAAAMTYGPKLDIDAVVSLSGEASLPEYHLDAIGSVPRLRVPLLIVGTRHDSYLSVTAARNLLRRAGSKNKRLLLFPGDRHGWDIVQGAPYAAQAKTAITDWISNFR